MKSIIQRVVSAQGKIDDAVVGSISHGCLILLGVEKSDTQESAQKLARKISRYRFFNDENGKMNVNIQQIKGAALVVSQFTLVADTDSGNRPGFSKGASPEQGRILYHGFMDALAQQGVPVQCGRFGANMQVSLINDGPVTFVINS